MCYTEKSSLTLLTKVRSICLANDIPMFLFGETALQAINSSELSDKLTVCIYARDAVSFCNAIDSYDDPFIAYESLLNNELYPDLTIRVYDPDTLDFSYNSFFKYRHNCIHLEVRLIRYTTFLNNALFKKKLTSYKKLPDVKKNTFKSGSVFESAAKLFGKKSGRLKVGSVTLDNDIFDKTRSVELCGMTFIVPEDSNRYLTPQFGAGWSHHSCSKYLESSGIFRSKLRSWREFEPLLVDFDISGFKSILKKYNELSADYNKYHRNILKCYDILNSKFTAIQSSEAFSAAQQNSDDTAVLQNRLLYLLKKVCGYLTDNGIVFYSFGGTTLGAVRHKGFIPWDDDIDLVMDIDNYKKLLKISDNLPFDDIVFNCYEKNHNYTRPFAQFTYTEDTRFVKSRMFMKGAALGSGIDIFVMDYVPSARIEEYTKNSLLYQELMTDVFINNEKIAEHIEDYLELKERVKEVGKDNVMEELSRRLEKYPRSECDLLAVRLWAKKIRVFEIDDIGTPSMMPFEDTCIPVPAKAETCLRKQYGYDWQIIPEYHEQKQHAFYIDLNTGSDYYMNAVNPELDWSQIDHDLCARKIAAVKRLPYKLELDTYRKKFDSMNFMLEFDMVSRLPELNACISRSDPYTFLTLLRPFTDKLSLFINADFKPDISERLIPAYIEYLVMSGEYYNALKASTVFSGVITGDLSALINSIQLLAEARECDDEEQISRVLSSVPDRYRKDIPDCIVADIELYLMKAPNSTDTAYFMKVCDDYLMKFPGNYDVMYAKAVLLQLNGDEYEACLNYREVTVNSNNGITVDKAQKRLHDLQFKQN